MNLTTRQIARLLVVLREPRCLEYNVMDANEDIFKLLTTEFVKRTSGKTLDFLQEVYVDYCDKHGLDHVSACEQRNLTTKQWAWLAEFDVLWEQAQNTEAANVDGFLMGEYNELEEQ